MVSGKNLKDFLELLVKNGRIRDFEGGYGSIDHKLAITTNDGRRHTVGFGNHDREGISVRMLGDLAAILGYDNAATLKDAIQTGDIG